ncbi:unnamed protein product, partial [Wuchereria bancrofti]
MDRNDGSSRDTRGTRIRAADGPIIYDDYDFYPDEKQTNNHEENMIVANFLRKHTPQNKNNAKLLSAETINYRRITSSESELPSSTDVTTIITTTETIELDPSVKSSTLTRLQVLISGENDRFPKKNFNFVSEAYREKPHRIFPRSDQSPMQVVPVRAMEQTFENETDFQLSTWQRYENGSLDRTTIKPNLRVILRDGQIEHNKIVTSSVIKSKSVPHANSLPKKRDEFELQQYETEMEYPKLSQKLTSKSSISEKFLEKQQQHQQQLQQQQQQQQQRQQQQQQQQRQQQQQQQRQQQQQQRQQQQQQQYEQSFFLNSPNAHAQPAAQNILVTPAKRYYKQNDQRERQSLQYQFEQQSSQYLPKVQQQSLRYRPQQHQQPTQYQPQQPAQYQPQQPAQYQPQQPIQY